MGKEYFLYHKKIKRILLLFVSLVIWSRYFTKTFASTINDSNVSIQVDNDGVCHIDETLYITCVDEPSSYIINYSQYPSIQLTRGGIENLHVNNLKLSDYYNKWWPNRSNYYDNYFSSINLFFPVSRKV